MSVFFLPFWLSLLLSCLYSIVIREFFLCRPPILNGSNKHTDTHSFTFWLAMTLLLVLPLLLLDNVVVSIFNRRDAPAYCLCCRRINNFLNGWRLSPFYIALGVALLMWPNSLWLCSVVGIQLLILAILRLFTIFRYQSNTIKCESLLQKQPTNREYFEK